MSTIAELVEAKLAASGLQGWTWSIASEAGIFRPLAIIQGPGHRISINGDTPDAALNRAIAQARALRERAGK